LVALLVAAASAAVAQTPAQPDCPVRVFTFTGPIASANYNNTNQGCTVWVAGYQSLGFSVISLHFQSSLDGVTWTDFAGDVVNGVNPQTVSPGSGDTRFSDTAASMSPGYFAPYVRLNLASATGSGTVVAWFYGYRAGSAGNAGGSSGGGGGGGCTAPCVVIGPDAAGAAPTQNGVQMNAYDGVDTQRVKSDTQGRLLLGPYPSSLPVSLSSSGLTQLIPLSGSTSITVGGFLISFASAVDFQFEYGTGSNCASGTTAITGVMKSVLTVAIDQTLAFKVPAGQALCANLGSGVTGGGLITYNQQ
jgi:hypothetical protein